MSSILFDGFKRQPCGDRKLELVDVGKMSAREIRREIGEVFDCDPDDLDLMRIDLYADVTGVPVGWFQGHSYLQRKRSLRTYQVEIKNDIKTIMFGSGANLIRIYDKSGLWRQEHRNIEKMAQVAGLEPPPLTEITGYDNCAVVTRIERQLRGRALPEELATVGMLIENAAYFDPFASLVLMPGGKPLPTPDDYSVAEYLRGMGARALIERDGLAAFRMFLNRRSKNNAAKLFRQIRDFLPADDDAFVVPDLTDLYQRGVGRQLKTWLPDLADSLRGDQEIA